MAALATLSNPAVNDSITAGGGSSTATAAGGGGGAGGNNNVERRCENADCNVIKLVSMVPKRKITQFVTEPTVMEKPMLINGFTTVFQVEGSSAKLSDLKNPNPTPTTLPKTIFRIVPNTHAHIVNYVVVDADGDSLRKINEGDPATMRKLLESQKVSADQMLKKLMAGHGPSVPIVCSSAPTPAGVNTVTNANVTNTQRGSIATGVMASNATASANLNTRTNATTSNVGSNITATAAGQTKAAAIQLPMRMHPNLKITAVASRDAIGQLVEPNNPTASTTQQQPVQIQVPITPAQPLITPIPLANLQNAPVVPSASAMAGASGIGPTPAGGDKTHIDKMQAELAELRRTVAMLAEAMPMNPQAQTALQKATAQQQPTRVVASKRQRLN